MTNSHGFMTEVYFEYFEQKPDFYSVLLFPPLSYGAIEVSNLESKITTFSAWGGAERQTNTVLRRYSTDSQ